MVSKGLPSPPIKCQVPPYKVLPLPGNIQNLPLPPPPLKAPF